MAVAVCEMDKVIQDYCGSICGEDLCPEDGSCVIENECDKCIGNFKSDKELCEKAYKKIMEFREQEAEQDNIVRMFIEDEQPNMVIHPNHYNQGSIECWDAMESTFGKEAVMTFCKLNAFKYLWRSDSKNGIEDVNKAINYLNHYKELRDER